MLDLKNAFAAEFAQLRDHPPIVLEIGAVEAWVLLAQLQLACRHPQNTGPSRQIAARIARQLQEAIASGGALAIVAEMGWQQAFDVAVEG